MKQKGKQKLMKAFHNKGNVKKYPTSSLNKINSGLGNCIYMIFETLKEAAKQNFL